MRLTATSLPRTSPQIHVLETILILPMGPSVCDERLPSFRIYVSLFPEATVLYAVLPQRFNYSPSIDFIEALFLFGLLYFFFIYFWSLNQALDILYQYQRTLNSLNQQHFL